MCGSQISGVKGLTEKTQVQENGEDACANETRICRTEKGNLNIRGKLTGSPD